MRKFEVEVPYVVILYDTVIVEVEANDAEDAKSAGIDIVSRFNADENSYRTIGDYYEQNLDGDLEIDYERDPVIHSVE